MGNVVIGGDAAALVETVHLPPLPARWTGASDSCENINLDDRASGVVISAHGLWYPPNGLMRVPAGDQISTYVPMGTVMEGCLGLRLDTGHGYGDDSRYLHVYTAGQLMPNFTFVYYIGRQGKHVVNPDKPITLDNLIRPDEGRITIAACASLYIPAGETLAQTLASVPVHTPGTSTEGGSQRVTITQDGQLQTSAASANP